MFLKQIYSNCLRINLHRQIWKFYSTKKSVILGIETSCDDTGCAIIDSDGNILGEALNSQQEIHTNMGGIIPPLAQNMHRKNIEKVVNDAINRAKIKFDDIDAIATTVKPGLPLSLIIGTKYGKYLCRKYNKPFIPIHHMEAHALTGRMINPWIEFPFLVLLISGGHCLLSIVKSVDEFLLLGKSLDDAPGEAFDKVARRLQLRNIKEFSHLCGGQLIEVAASRADNMLEFEFKIPMANHKDCNFSLGGLKTKAFRHIIKEEKKNDLPPDGIIPGAYNLAAGFQLTITRHLCHRTQRAMEYIHKNNLIPKEKRVLVVSGGVACNNFIAKGLQLVCDHYNYHLVRPPAKLCTDNGIMIAWNGVERWKTHKGITTDLDSVDIESSCPLGVDISEDIKNQNLKCQWVKLTSIVKTNEQKTHFNVV